MWDMFLLPFTLTIVFIAAGLGVILVGEMIGDWLRRRWLRCRARRRQRRA